MDNLKSGLILIEHNDGGYHYVNSSTKKAQDYFLEYRYGKMSREGFYLDGRYHGEFRRYSATGRLLESRYYDNGKAILWAGAKHLSKQEKMMYVLKYGGEFLK